LYLMNSLCLLNSFPVHPEKEEECRKGELCCVWCVQFIHCLLT
jgi:hypothetical protein